MVSACLIVSITHGRAVYVVETGSGQWVVAYRALEAVHVEGLVESGASWAIGADSLAALDAIICKKTGVAQLGDGHPPGAAMLAGGWRPPLLAPPSLIHPDAAPRLSCPEFALSSPKRLLNNHTRSPAAP